MEIDGKYYTVCVTFSKNNPIIVDIFYVFVMWVFAILFDCNVWLVIL